jgi:hypothetical protein
MVQTYTVIHVTSKENRLGTKKQTTVKDVFHLERSLRTII